MSQSSVLRPYTIFIDTGAFYALANSKDTNHQVANKFLNDLSEKNTSCNY